MLLFWNQILQVPYSTFPSVLPRFCREKASEKNYLNFATTQVMVTVRDICNYSTFNESFLKSILFVVPLQLTFGFFNHTITCLTNNDDVVTSQTHHIQDSTNTSPPKKISSVSI